MKIASIDLGTNTFRLLIVESDRENFKVLLRDSRVTGLGKGFNKESHSISGNSIDKALKALREFSEILSGYDIDYKRIVATSVVREALNADKFISVAKAILNSNIDVIDGETEAELMVIGVLKSINYKGNKLIIDIGGGSTEFVYVNNQNNIECSKSTGIGVVKYSDMYLFSDKINDSDRERIYGEIYRSVADECGELGILSDDFQIVVTAGTPTTLAAIDMRLIKYDHKLVNNYVLSKQSLNSIISTLTKLNSKQRLNIPGMHAGREDLIIPGSLIILSLLNFYNRDKIIVSDGGLLEGIIYKYLMVKSH